MHDLEILTQQFCDYSTYIKGYKPNTINRYKGVLRLFRRHSGASNLEDISNDKLRLFFIYGRTERAWNANTYLIYHKTLVVFLRWCREHGYRKDDPMEGIDVPKVPKRLPEKLTKQQAERILEAVENLPYSHEFLRRRNYAIFQMFMLTGVRKSELLSLKMVDVDVENLTIFVRQGKGSKDRVIPMTYTLAQHLRRYLIERKKARKLCPFFFTSWPQDRGYTHSGLKRVVDNVKKATGINFHIHKLRHTFATLMLEGGCDIYSLSRMMGHADIKTTTIYLSASAEHLRGQVSKHPLNSN